MGKYFPKGEKQIVDYNGGRDLDSLIKFVENEGKEVEEADEEDEDEEDVEEEEAEEGHDELYSIKKYEKNQKNVIILLSKRINEFPLFNSISFDNPTKIVSRRIRLKNMNSKLHLL